MSAHPERASAATDECVVYSVPEVGKMLGLGRNGAYAAAERGEIPIIRIGRLMRVPKVALEKMLAKAAPKQRKTVA